MSPDILRPVADLLIALGTVAVLIFVVRAGPAGMLSHRGRGLMVIGFALTVIVGLSDLLLGLVLPQSSIVSEPNFLHGVIPYWFYWLITRLAFVLVLVGLWLAMIQRVRDEKEFRESRQKVDVASAHLLQSEARFRHLYETTTNSIYCFTFDPPMPLSLSIEEQIVRSHEAILTECNRVFAKELLKEHPSDVIGRRMGTLHSNADHDAHSSLIQNLAENDYKLTDYEMLYSDPGGDERAIKMSITGIVRDGLLHRFWGVESNILDLRQTKAALARRQTFQGLLAHISSTLITATAKQADEEVNNCIRLVCEYIEADRVAIFWLNRVTHAGELTYGWTSEGTTLLTNMVLPNFPMCTKQILNAQVVRIDEVSQMADDWIVDRKELENLGLKSFVAVPLIADGEVVGVQVFSHLRATRKFLDHDVSDLRVLADLFANFILRLKSTRELDRALVSLKKATDRLDAENVYLRQEIELTLGFDEIIGRSDGMTKCLQLVEQVAGTDTPVLILGETGTGKELIARAIHEHSNRSDRPLVKVNCAALPANLIESELFGYEKGAFTGADRAKRGRFDLANGSSIFLDEFGEIPLELQSKLLRVLQEGEFERLGGTKTNKVDVRIIAATNRDIARAVREGEFRSDLLYRINAFPIEVPPLRDRGNDIPLLAEHFVQMHAQRLGRNISAISARMMRELRDYSWPGNIRELEGVIQRALISSNNEVLDLAVPLSSGSSVFGANDADKPEGMSAALHKVERQHILSVLNEVDWRISGDSGAASRLGMPPSTLRSKMQKLAISRPN